MATDYSKPQEGWRDYRVGHGVLLEDDRLLLAGNAWYPGEPLVWTLPGGRCEEGEAAIDAVVREFREETGLEVEAGALLYVAEARSVVQRRHFLTCAFAVRRVGGMLQAGEDPAVREVRAVPLADLPTYLPQASLGAPLRYWLAHPDAPTRYWFFPEYTTE